MAVTPNDNQAFLREVDEELRRDQLASALTRYGRWLIAAVVLGLVAFGGVLLWRNHQRDAAGAAGEQLQQAFDDLGNNRLAAASAALAPVAASRAPGYRAVAAFAKADIQLQKKDATGAAATFAGIAADPSNAQPFRDLALIRQTSTEYDTLKPRVIVDRLKPLAVPGNPWFGSAGEMVAAAYVRMNRRDLAGALFGQIASDETVPDSLRQRAVQMAGSLGIDAVGQNEEKTAR